MNKKIIILFSLGLLLLGGIIFHRKITRIIKNIYKHAKSVKMSEDCKNCDIYFQDNVATQSQAYLNEKISPQNNFDDLFNLEKNGTLVRISNCDDYILSNLTHSVPLVMPKAANFIKLLAEEYKKNCSQRNYTYVAFSITSCTRSKKSVQELVRQNPNAVANSAHLNGKTIDITYIWPLKYSGQKICFIDALNELKDKGLCYVKFETYEKCLHITAR